MLTDLWFDREGKPITDMNDVEKKLVDKNYKVVIQEYTAQGYYWVSTVCLGLDHGTNWMLRGVPKKPVIFETMVFVQDGGKEKYHHEMNRYETEEQALAGHKKMLKRMQDVENRQVKKLKDN